MALLALVPVSSPHALSQYQTLRNVNALGILEYHVSNPSGFQGKQLRQQCLVNTSCILFTENPITLLSCRLTIASGRKSSHFESLIPSGIPIMPSRGSTTYTCCL
jgi:hypothetical protein